MNIALKEASETEYWLELLFECDYLSDIQYQSIQADCSELNKILIDTQTEIDEKSIFYNWLDERE